MNPFQRAREEGYNDKEIYSFLQTHPKYKDKISRAREEGYDDEEISSFLQQYSPKKEEGYLNKAGRLAGQFGLGALENAILPAEVGAAIAGSETGQKSLAMQELGPTLEFLLEKQSLGNWTEEDQKALDYVENALKDPTKIDAPAQNYSITGAIEKATGLKPEGFLEKAARITGLIKNPSNIQKVLASPNAKNIIKAALPSIKEGLRGSGAAAGLVAAEEGEFGPVGTIASLLIGDLIGGGVTSVAKGLISPKKSLSKVIAAFTPKESLSLQKEIINQFRESGIQADLGSITNSDAVRVMQSRLAQSGLVGKELKNFRNQMVEQVVDEYKDIASSLGKVKDGTRFETTNAVKNSLVEARDAEKAQLSKMYTSARESLPERTYVDSTKLANTLSKLEKELKPGTIKSKEQMVVLDAIEDLKRDLYDSSGGLMGANVSELLNSKIALNDLINYEVQGGAKQLLKSVVGDIDRAIISAGKDHPRFAKQYINANKRFSEHAKKFRNRFVDTMLKNETNPEKLLDSMNTVHNIKRLEKSLPAPVFQELKALKLQDMIGDNLLKGTVEQIQTGKFNMLMKNPKQRALLKEVLGNDAFKRLDKLGSNSQRLQDSINKFYNSSQSFTAGADMVVAGKLLTSFLSLLGGNPWPLMKTTGSLVGVKQASKLMSDPAFLREVEEAVLALDKNDVKHFENIVDRLRPALMQLMNQNPSSDEV